MSPEKESEKLHSKNDLPEPINGGKVAPKADSFGIKSAGSQNSKGEETQKSSLNEGVLGNFIDEEQLLKDVLEEFATGEDDEFIIRE
jgi:hypothetical protein